MSWYRQWKPYVPVHTRRAQAASYAARLAKQEKRTLVPIRIEGRSIARSFWGQAWCQNLECYSDYENRLPRGRTYVRNGSVIDLQIERGQVKALVSGSNVYRVTVKVKTLPRAVWKRLQADCASSIHSLIDLLQGRFDQGVMQRLSQRDGGLFPQPSEIDMDCTCPDWAGMCKHLAAVLYGIGARLDAAPELLFTLRNVDHLELVAKAVAAENLDRSLGGPADAALAGADLGAMFGIELDAGAGSAKRPRGKSSKVPTRSPSAKKPAVAEATAAEAPRRTRRAPKPRAAVVAASAKAAKTAGRPKGRRPAK